MSRRAVFGVLLLCVLPAAGQGQPSLVEHGVFNLHKFEQLIGRETYTFTHAAAGVTLNSDFKFTDRGTEVPLKATLTMADDLTPRDFQIKGKISRYSPVEDNIHGRSAANSRLSVAAGESFFDVEAYAPVAIQMAMVRYWRQHGSPLQLKTLPHGVVEIREGGVQEIKIQGRQVSLHKFQVRGVIWGMELLWFDAQQKLVALVGCDAEFDHFEAIAEDYEEALGVFISTAAQDGMNVLAKMQAPLAKPASPTIAIVGGRLIDGTGKAPLENSVVVMREGKIVAAGPASSTPVPQDAQQIDARGKSVLPGLWEMHAHFEQVEWGPIYLATGVTTVRDVGNELEFIRGVRDAIAAGRGLGPRILMAGIVDGTSQLSLGTIRVDTPDQAREQVRRYRREGFQQIKIYSSVKPEIVSIITDEAHRLGMTVTGHVPVNMDVMQAIDRGMDQINHVAYVTMAITDPKTNTINSDSPRVKEVLDALIKHHTVVDPTLALMELIFHPRNQPVSEFEPGIAKVAPEMQEQLNSMGAAPERAVASQQRFKLLVQTVALLHKAGVPLVVGTDQAVPGYSIDREMELYVKAGFTPMQAIQAATLASAQAMKMDQDSGTIEPGKRADVIIVDGNPLENISDIRKVRGVFTADRMLEPAFLWKAVGFRP